MIGQYLKDRQHEVDIGLGWQGRGIVMPIEVKSQDTTFGLGFYQARWDIREMIAKKRDKRRVKRNSQTFEHPWIFSTYPLPCQFYYTPPNPNFHLFSL